MNMPLINRESSVDRILGTEPGTALSVQSQFAYLQLAQSRFCKEKAEECMRQVQDAQENQRKTQIYIAEANRLMQKARADGYTDVNKELEAFCKANNIPFTKIEVKAGKLASFAILGSIIGWIGVGVAGFITGGLLGIRPAKIICMGLDLGVWLLKTLRPLLPEHMRGVADFAIMTMEWIRSWFGDVKATPEARRQSLEEMGARMMQDPNFTSENLTRLVHAGVDAGIFTQNGVRKVAAEMGMDLDAFLEALKTEAESMQAAAPAAPNDEYDIEMTEAVARILSFPVCLFAMAVSYLFGGNLSYEGAFKIMYTARTSKVCDADSWQNNIKQLESFAANQSTQNQHRMVLINNFIGQYNSFLQGAMTALYNANQVMTAIAKGS